MSVHPVYMLCDIITEQLIAKQASIGTEQLILWYDQSASTVPNVTFAQRSSLFYFFPCTLIIVSRPPPLFEGRDPFRAAIKESSSGHEFVIQSYLLQRHCINQIEFLNHDPKFSALVHALGPAVDAVVPVDHGPVFVLMAKALVIVGALASLRTEWLVPVAMYARGRQLEAVE